MVTCNCHGIILCVPLGWHMQQDRPQTIEPTIAATRINLAPLAEKPEDTTCPPCGAGTRGACAPQEVD